MSLCWSRLLIMLTRLARRWVRQPRQIVRPFGILTEYPQLWQGWMLGLVIRFILPRAWRRRLVSFGDARLKVDDALQQEVADEDACGPVVVKQSCVVAEDGHADVDEPAHDEETSAEQIDHCAIPLFC